MDHEEFELTDAEMSPAATLWRRHAEAAYRESLLIIEQGERRKAWAHLGDEVRGWLKRNWKLLLGIAIGYVLAGAAIYLDAWFQAVGITR